MGLKNIDKYSCNVQRRTKSSVTVCTHGQNELCVIYAKRPTMSKLLIFSNHAESIYVIIYVIFYWYFWNFRLLAIKLSNFARFYRWVIVDVISVKNNDRWYNYMSRKENKAKLPKLMEMNRSIICHFIHHFEWSNDLENRPQTVRPSLHSCLRQSTGYFESLKQWENAPLSTITNKFNQSRALLVFSRTI